MSVKNSKPKGLLFFGLRDGLPVNQNINPNIEINDCIDCVGRIIDSYFSCAPVIHRTKALSRQIALFSVGNEAAVKS